MTAPGILGIFAHPDDESFGPGGAIAAYALNGTPVDILCATRGEAGQLGDPPVTTREGLGAAREEALRDAVRILGFRDVYLLAHHDGELADVPYDTLLGEVMDVMRRVRPATVLTFGPRGIYGHPDHIRIWKAATEAFWRLRGSVPELHRLYYHAIPRRTGRAMNRAIPGPEGTPNTELPIPPHALEAQIAALAEHAKTQLDARGMRERLMQLRPTVAYLYRVEPPLPYGEIDRSLLP
ncbi:MAG: PIG-L family deacetylase [Chloroflexota bacterium]|nr:PIG-L family deacetylase [Chloroflexota bacterium]